MIKVGVIICINVCYIKGFFVQRQLFHPSFSVMSTDLSPFIDQNFDFLRVHVGGKDLWRDIMIVIVASEMPPQENKQAGEDEQGQETQLVLPVFFHISKEDVDKL